MEKLLLRKTASPAFHFVRSFLRPAKVRKRPRLGQMMQIKDLRVVVFGERKDVAEDMVEKLHLARLLIN